MTLKKRATKAARQVDDNDAEAWREVDEARNALKGLLPDKNFVFVDELGDAPFTARTQDLIRRHTLDPDDKDVYRDAVMLIGEIKSAQRAAGNDKSLRWRELEAIKLKIWKEVFHVGGLDGEDMRDPYNLAGQTPRIAATKEAPVKLDPTLVAQYISEKIEALEAQRVTKDAEVEALDTKIDEAKTAIYNALNANPEKFEYQMSRVRDQFTITVPTKGEENEELYTTLVNAITERDQASSASWEIGRQLKAAAKDLRIVQAAAESVDAATYDDYL